GAWSGSPAATTSGSSNPTCSRAEPATMPGRTNGNPASPTSTTTPRDPGQGLGPDGRPGSPPARSIPVRARVLGERDVLGDGQADLLGADPLGPDLLDRVCCALAGPKLLELVVDLLDLGLGSVLQIDELGAGLVDGGQQLVELDLHGQGVLGLRPLEEE